jgi:hypothetical protein
MCNFYSITTSQAAIIALSHVVNRYIGNLPPMPGVFPDYRRLWCVTLGGMDNVQRGRGTKSKPVPGLGSTTSMAS